MKIINYDDDTKSGISDFSRGRLEVLLRWSEDKYELVSDFGLALLPVLAEFGAVLYADHVGFHSRPAIPHAHAGHRASTPRYIPTLILPTAHAFCRLCASLVTPHTQRQFGAVSDRSLVRLLHRLLWDSTDFGVCLCLVLYYIADL